jgi:hypothetical protein
LSKSNSFSFLVEFTMANFFAKLFGADNSDLAAVENQLDRTAAQLDETAAALAQTQAELADLKAAPAPEPQVIEVPVMIEQLVGTRIQVGSATNKVDKTVYEARFGGKAPVSAIISEMFSSVNMGTIASATLISANKAEAPSSVAIDSILPKEMPAQIIVNTVLGEGGFQ